MRPSHLLIIPAFVLSLAAQEPARPGFIRFHPLLSALDRDQDGVISPEELQAAPAALAKLDANQDGFVTAEEMRPARFGRRQGAEQGPGESGPPEAGDIVKTLMAFDANGDGKLSKSEVPERMQGLFARADTDKDGVLTAAELTSLAQAQSAGPAGGPGREGRREGGPGPGRGRMDPILAALDTDGDGRISKSEMQNSVAALKALDKNGDGKLTEDEVRPSFGPGREGRRPAGENGFGRGPRE